MAFPSNPSDKMIYEASPDIFFIYDKQTVTWRKLPKSIKLPLATPFSNGAMSSEDYFKLLNIKSDPFTTTLTSDQCDLTFSSGQLSIGGDDFITVRTLTDFGNPITGMPNVEMKLKINQNTAIIDMTVDPHKLALELIRRGNLRLKGSKGNRGKKGKRGRDGLKVETGPKGPNGLPGKSSCGALVSEDILAVAGTIADGMAIVDIDTQITPEGDTKLIAYRSAIGDETIAPHTIDVECETSSWLVALSGMAADSVVVPDLKSCTIPSLDSPSGGQRLYYLDISPIISAIKAKYNSEAERIRVGSANVATFWLQIMNQLYTLSKDALCCALYECKKQKAIDDAAAASGTSGTPPPAGFMMSPKLESMAPTALTSVKLAMTPETPKATAVLEPGVWRLRYLKFPVTGQNGSHAEFVLVYKHALANRSFQVAGFKPNTDIDVVRSQYNQYSITVSHDGGPISVELIKGSAIENGEVIINLTRANNNTFGKITSDDFGVLSDACSTGKVIWMAIIHTPIQEFSVFKVSDQRVLNLLSSGHDIPPGQCFAIPVVNHELVDCSGSLLSYDDVLRDSLLRSVNDGSFDLYKGNATKVDMMNSIMQFGIICPWLK